MPEGCPCSANLPTGKDPSWSVERHTKLQVALGRNSRRFHTRIIQPERMEHFPRSEQTRISKAVEAVLMVQVTGSSKLHLVQVKVVGTREG